MPPDTCNPTLVSYSNMAPGVVTDSQYKEESILTGTPFGSTVQSKGASGSKDALGFEEVFGFF